MNTLVYHSKDLYADSEKLKNAAEILKNGGLVVIPTETVYGIAARADKAGIEALNELKQRDLSKFYSLHIPNTESLKKYVQSTDMRTAKLVRNFWPGPVTVVFSLTDQQVDSTVKALGKQWEPMYKENSIGVRCPDNEITSKLLELAQVPILATSANLSGMPAAVDFDQAFQTFNEKVPLIINDGACEESMGSTVVRIKNGNIDILREGAINSEEIADISTVNIVFVCSTNTCCSPIAAEICRKLLSKRIGCDVERLRLFGYNISSAGVMAPIKQPLRTEALNLGKNLGFDLSDHISTPLAPRDILCCDLILTMDADQKKRIVDFYPQLEDRCKLLAGDYDICDPADGSSEVYSKFADVVENAINERIGELLI
ncbi:MAG: L-threonylcarbamoyladenylate synthase [Sedimentisphaeraceae bacterium JB056]